jgi:hypothetical protein
MRVPNSMPLGSPLSLTTGSMYDVATLKVTFVGCDV